MSARKPIHCWAVIHRCHRAFREADICFSRVEVQESLDAWGGDLEIVPCMLVPIEPKRRKKVRR